MRSGEKDFVTAGIILIIGLILHVVTNIYFGWNELPESQAEKWCISTVRMLFIFSVVKYTSPFFRWYQKKFKDE